MGEMADMFLEGWYCQECSEFLGEGQGWPTTCRACQLKNRRSDLQEERTQYGNIKRPPSKHKPFRCICTKNFKHEHSLKQHCEATGHPLNKSVTHNGRV